MQAGRSATTTSKPRCRAFREHARSRRDIPPRPNRHGDERDRDPRRAAPPDRPGEQTQRVRRVRDVARPGPTRVLLERLQEHISPSPARGAEAGGVRTAGRSASVNPAQLRTKKPNEKTVARGYRVGHRADRRRWEPQVKTGTVPCRRCGELIRPDEPWDLGHDDLDRTLPRAPEHRRCNRATRGHAAKRRKRRSRLYGPRVRSREW